MDRKELIKILETKFGVKARYLKVPTCAYEIVINEEIYKIDKEGRILKESGDEIELKELLAEHEFFETEETEITDYELILPLEGHNARSLRNLINMIFAKQSLINKALGSSGDMLTEKFVLDINEMPMDNLSEFQSAISSSSDYKSQEVEINFEDELLKFKIGIMPEKLEAFIELFSLINKNSMLQHYASYKAKATDNEKYTFRTWLIRLGMIGDEYKKVRKELLKALPGNGAFKSGTKKAERIKPKCKLRDQNTNIYNLMGIAANALKKAGLGKASSEMIQKISESQSYDEALRIIMEYVDEE